MHPHLTSQLIADRQAGLMASARQQRLARQARAARQARPAQRGRAAPMLAALGRLARRYVGDSGPGRARGNTSTSTAACGMRSACLGEPQDSLAAAPGHAQSPVR